METVPRMAVGLRELLAGVSIMPVIFGAKTGDTEELFDFDSLLREQFGRLWATHLYQTSTGKV